MLQYKFPMTEYISIHALAKRATLHQRELLDSI